MLRLSLWILGVTAALGCQTVLAADPPKEIVAAPAANSAGCAPAAAGCATPCVTSCCPTTCAPSCCKPAPTCCPSTCCAPQVPCLANACCDNGCGGCGGGRIIGGVGLYVLQPYFENNPAVNVTTLSITDTGDISAVLSTSRNDLHHHMDAAPEIWAGYLNEDGLGGRVRWFYFRQGTDQAFNIPAAAATADGLTATLATSAAPLGIQAFSIGLGDNPVAYATTSKLQIQILDLEALQDLRTGNWDFLFGAGLRLAHINQAYNAFGVIDASGLGLDAPVTNSLLSSHSFHGVGPTVALDLRRYLGDGNFALYSRARGSVLFGSAKQQASITTNPIDIGGGDLLLVTAQANDHRNRTMVAAELELGAEVSRNVGLGRAFGQVALVGQNWFGAGSASRSAPTSLEGINIGGATADSDIGLFGFVFRVGLNY